MPNRFIGSTGLLRYGRCQNNIWVTQGDPNHPVPGDVRIIIQAVNPAAGIIYCEVWNLHVNGWIVLPILPFLRVIDATFGAGVILIPNAIPHHNITNQLLGVPIIMGYRFLWQDVIYLDVNIPGVPLWYIRHARRRNRDIYLRPRPGNPQWMAVDRLELGTQINEFRRAWI